MGTFIELNPKSRILQLGKTAAVNAAGFISAGGFKLQRAELLVDGLAKPGLSPEVRISRLEKAASLLEEALREPKLNYAVAPGAKGGYALKAVKARELAGLYDQLAITHADSKNHQGKADSIFKKALAHKAELDALNLIPGTDKSLSAARANARESMLEELGWAIEAYKAAGREFHSRGDQVGIAVALIQKSKAGLLIAQDEKRGQTAKVVSFEEAGKMGEWAKKDSSQSLGSTDGLSLLLRGEVIADLEYAEGILAKKAGEQSQVPQAIKDLNANLSELYGLKASAYRMLEMAPEAEQAERRQRNFQYLSR